MTPSDRELRTFTGLRRIVSTLRAPGGCPWDRVQTHRTLRPYLIEEAHEALAALDDDDPERLCEELGDLLLEVLLHVQIAEEHGEFRLSDMIHGIAHKLVRRHPHVFADAVAETPEEVVDQWDELKRVERGTKSALTGIPLGLPALAYAQAIQRRAAKAGFAFEAADQAWEAFEEELVEFRSAETPESRRDELGDVIFALVNVARWHDVDAEDALRDTCHSFTQSFRHMEDVVRKRGIDLRDVATAEKLALWEEAKVKAP